MIGPVRHPAPAEYGRRQAGLQGLLPVNGGFGRGCGIFGRRIFARARRITVSLPQARRPDTRASQDCPAMNAPLELNIEEMIRIRLPVLRREHRELDQAIRALTEMSAPDQLALRRLKKRKLALKDQIVRLEDQLIPDIIA